MKYQKFNKYEKKENRHINVTNALAGSGLYIYENSSKEAELTLPRPTRTGVRKVGPKQRFQGDDYYMQLVKTGFLRLIEVLQTPEQEKEVTMLEEQKLILDQPDRVTNKGKVEQVVEKKTPKQKLNEGGNSTPTPDVLLNENPGDDGFVVITG
jgi:hypothetical protein